MFQLSKPGDEAIRVFLRQQSQLSLDYSRVLVGGTQGQVPEGYAGAHYRTRLGVGTDTFAAASEALRAWHQFPAGFVEVYPARPPLEVGVNVALRIRAVGLWARAAACIVDTVDERISDDGGDIWRFGFAYGTLPGHLESGEERFLVEWHAADDSVWYDLKSFSRPSKLLVWLGLPIARYYQRRFAYESAEAMIRAVGQRDELQSASLRREGEIL